MPRTDSPPAAGIPRLPRKKAKRSHATLISFLVCVIGPMLVATIYYCFLVSGQYASEFRFSVQDASSQAMASSAATSMLSMLGGGGTVNSSQNYLVVDFLSSAEAVRELQQRVNLMELYSRPEIDWWSRFDSTKSVDEFVLYWKKMITANYDQVTGLAHVEVRAFRPEDAYAIAGAMVALSEQLINRIATRQQVDAVKFAEAEVNKAQDRLRVLQQQLTTLRNKSGVIDPSTSIVASNSTLAQTMRAGLAQLETNLSTLRRQNLGPSAPAVIALQQQIKATKDQLAQLESSVGNSGDGSPLSGVVDEFERLTLERTFAQTALTSVLAILDQARAMAASQRLYITPYVQPQLPGVESYPRKTLMISLTGAIAFMLWTVGLLVARAIGEHYI